MFDRKLRDYIRQSLDSGLSKNQIIPELKKVGWQDDDIGAAFDSIQGVVIQEAKNVKNTPRKKSLLIFTVSLLSIILILTVGFVIYASRKEERKVNVEPLKLPKTPEEARAGCLSACELLIKGDIEPGKEIEVKEAFEKCKKTCSSINQEEWEKQRQVQQEKAEEAKRKSNDAIRQTDLIFLSKDLETYYTEHNMYPLTLKDLPSSDAQSKDPQTSLPYEYKIQIEGKDFLLCADFETKKDQCLNSEGQWVPK